MCRTSWILLCCAVWGPLSGARVQAEVLVLDGPSDSRRILGQTQLDVATFEARVLFTAELGKGGLLFNEWDFAVEDKRLLVGPNFLAAYSHPVSAGALAEANVPLSLGVWHHVAYVYDGTEERLYLDGRAVTRRPASGSIGDGPREAPTLGAASRDRVEVASMEGYVDYVRISSLAKYSGDWFIPPTLSLPPADATTALQYSFSTTVGGEVPDESSNGINAGCWLITKPCPDIAPRLGRTLGDFGGDGEANNLDIQLAEVALRDRARFESEHPGVPLDLVGDTNGDGQFSVADGDYLSRWFGVLLPVPGDASGDRAVDLTDFGILKGAFGSAGGPSDFDLSGTVDLSDFGTFKSAFGFRSEVSSVAQVPEPLAAELAVLGGAGLLLFRRHVRQRRARKPVVDKSISV